MLHYCWHWDRIMVCIWDRRMRSFLLLCGMHNEDPKKSGSPPTCFSWHSTWTNENCISLPYSTSRSKGNLSTEIISPWTSFSIWTRNRSRNGSLVLALWNTFWLFSSLCRALHELCVLIYWRTQSLCQGCIIKESNRVCCYFVSALTTLKQCVGMLLHA